jgi:hypothetical protein
MSNENHPTDAATTAPSLEQVRQRFESWRQSREKRTRIPQSLWKAAVALSEEYSIHHLSKVLRVNYAALKNQVLKLNPPDPSASYVSTATFLELPPAAPVVESTIEIVRADGAAMTMHLKAATGSDLLELAKAFWAGGS